jgi:hypothetical protein
MSINGKTDRDNMTPDHAYSLPTWGSRKEIARPQRHASMVKAMNNGRSEIGKQRLDETLIDSFFGY